MAETLKKKQQHNKANSTGNKPSAESVQCIL